MSLTDNPKAADSRSAEIHEQDADDETAHGEETVLQSLSYAVPWFASDSISWLEHNLRPDDSVLEFGGGRSTLFFLGRCNWVTTVETSPEWTVGLLEYLTAHPNLYRRWQLHHIPVDWSPNWDHRSGGYWGRNDVSLDWRSARELERRYLGGWGNTDDHTVLVIDGGLRSHLYVLFAEHDLYRRFEIVVIDNMERRFPAMLFGELDPSDFERFDFVAGSFDNKLPAELDGRQVTTVFVRRDRLAAVTDVETENPYSWSQDDLIKHQLFDETDDGSGARRWHNRIRSELAAYGLLPETSSEPA